VVPDDTYLLTGGLPAFSAGPGLASPLAVSRASTSPYSPSAIGAPASSGANSATPVSTFASAASPDAHSALWSGSPYADSMAAVRSRQLTESLTAYSLGSGSRPRPTVQSMPTAAEALSQCKFTLRNQ